MTDLLKEAIADAKAVREVALANAKLALEEAFTPRLQSMLSAKLSEEAEDMGGEMEDEMTEGDDEEMMDEEEDMDMDSYMEEGEDEESMEEGDMADGDEIHMEEGEDEDFEDEEDFEDDEEFDFDDEEDMGSEEETEEPMDEDLMEIIRQLEEELDSSDIGTGDNKKPSASASDDHTQMKDEPLIQLVEEEEEEEMSEGEGEDDEIDIQEIIRALREEDEEDEEELHEEEEEEAPSAEAEEKLQEAYAVIQFLRSKINEVNLLNSKLLFSNKLFRSHSLTESQKMTVIENFDRAGSLREVKLVYATLAESLKSQSTKAKKPVKRASLKEAFNRGASKPQVSTRPSKQILSESNSVADRFKKLAGII